MITTEPLDLDRDIALLHRWVTHPRSVFWGMQGASLVDVATEYSRIAADPHHHALLGRVAGEPAFLVELYDPAHSDLAGLPELASGDRGMHVLVAPPTVPIPGFTRSVFRAVMELCFADPGVRRVVVEPDVRNDAIARLNAEAGFVVARRVPLRDKVAALSFVTRDGFARSPLAADPTRTGTAR